MLDKDAARDSISTVPVVTVIIPALNEAKNLPHILPKIPASVGEVLLVDGHSTDDTVAIAKTLCPEIRVICQDGRGKGNALKNGVANAVGDIIVTIDADGSMDPEEIPRFITPLLEGDDFVKGSRFVTGGGTLDMPWLRRTGNRVLTTLVNVLYRGQYTDITYGYNSYWKTVFERVRLDTDGFETEIEMLVKVTKAGFRVREIPSFESKRLEGTGYLRTFRDGWRILRTILRERVRG